MTEKFMMKVRGRVLLEEDLATFKVIADAVQEATDKDREAILALIANEKASLPPHSNAREQVLDSIDEKIRARGAK